MEFEHLVQCSIYFLKMSGMDPEQLPKATKMKQRYKLTSQLIDMLRAKGVQVEVSLFLSPSVPDIRNFLLNLLGKSE
jgi:hypothetical protein